MKKILAALMLANCATPAANARKMTFYPDASEKSIAVVCVHDPADDKAFLCLSLSDFMRIADEKRRADRPQGDL